MIAVTTTGSAVYRNTADRWETDVEPRPEAEAIRRAGSPVVVPIRVGSDRLLRPGNDDGLYLTEDDGTVVAHYTEANSDLPHNAVRALLEDRQGRYWIGTSGGGLSRMIPTGLRHFDRTDGLADNRAYALHADDRGRLWIGGRRGIQYRDSTGFQRPAIDDPTVGAKITGITSSGPNTLFSTDGRGVVILDDSNRVERISTKSGLPSDWVLTVIGGTDPGVTEAWAFTYTEGVAHLVYRDSAWVVTNYNVPPRQGKLSVRSVLSDGQGSFFLGGSNGRIFRWRWEEGQTTIKPEVLDATNGLPDAPIKALALRRGTQLWVGVLGHGLYYTDLRMEPAMKFFPLPTRLQTSNNIYQLTAPPNRPEVWIGTENGVDRLLLNGDGQPDVLRKYSRAEGFVGGETTGASLVDPSGNLWFGTMNGLVRYEEAGVEDRLEPPATFMEGVDLFYEPITDHRFTENGLLHGVVYAADENHFNFRFRAVDLTYPDRIRYRYRLTGLAGTDWSPLTRETAVRFAEISPGFHRFEAQATTDGGKTFGETAHFELNITSPLWRKPWFLGLIALLASALLVGGFYFFYRRVQQREAGKRRRLEARNQVLELEQKALRLQMNPHFIFNALNGIRGLVDGKNDAEARAQISRFATLMRGILNNSRQDQITLAEEIRVLDDYLKMEQFCQSFPFTYAISVPDDLDPEEVSLPPMLLQPFVENAVLHGLSGKENAGHIDIQFSLRGRRMRCLVSDNGIGRTAAAERRKARAPGHKSVALDVTRARLRSLAGTLVIADRKGGGTEVEVVVPVDSW